MKKHQLLRACYADLLDKNIKFLQCNVDICFSEHFGTGLAPESYHKVLGLAVKYNIPCGKCGGCL